ncbi:MAG: hypothetical protein FWD61_16680 [Phycisphaerales bacterium]|nr:hypothetical protein [Phycisphaerales bacterium]
MDLEKLASRARCILSVISLLGLLVMAAGLFLTLTVLSHVAGSADSYARDWVEGLYYVGGPMALVAAGLLMMVIPAVLYPITSLLFRRAIDMRYQTEQFLTALDAQRRALEKIRDVACLSDAAKQVAFRNQDLQALRAAIHEDMDKGDFEAATILANEMERRFGYVLEADRFREQIQATSRAAIDARVRETSNQIDILIAKLEWFGATREAERIQRQFPAHPESRKLMTRIESARDEHKLELLKDWKDAVARDDIERSVKLLKQLDQYLSPSEATAYKETAHDVFRKRQQQLQTQLAQYVHDKNWSEALRIGQQITDEFPNTRMAAEVRERLPILQENARLSAPA